MLEATKSLKFVIAHFAKTFYPKRYSFLKEQAQAIYNKYNSAGQLERISILECLLISGEDHRFNYHFGFDPIAICRAIKNRIFHRRIEGASTIHQQLVRVLTNDFERTRSRKFREICLATTLSDIIPRHTIPLLYLHVAYFGASMNGLQQALTKLNIISLNTISIETAAGIIARLKYPEPGQLNEKREKQIELRKKHLLMLYERHQQTKWLPIYGKYS